MSGTLRDYRTRAATDAVCADRRGRFEPLTHRSGTHGPRRRAATSERDRAGRPVPQRIRLGNCARQSADQQTARHPARTRPQRAVPQAHHGARTHVSPCGDAYATLLAGHAFPSATRSLRELEPALPTRQSRLPPFRRSARVKLVPPIMLVSIIAFFVSGFPKWQFCCAFINNRVLTSYFPFGRTAREKTQHIACSPTKGPILAFCCLYSVYALFGSGNFDRSAHLRDLHTIRAISCDLTNDEGAMTKTIVLEHSTNRAIRRSYYTNIVM